jgi:excisionase family DNA binding protein
MMRPPKLSHSRAPRRNTPQDMGVPPTVPSPDASRPGILGRLPRPRGLRALQPAQRPFGPLIDARQAGRLLGVPHTWLLAQARANRIPHHRLGHYVRFNAEDLQAWLAHTRLGPVPPTRSSRGEHGQAGQPRG